jgi:hypothetical protein
MKVLDSVEREAFESSPILNGAERKRCFDFPFAIQIAARQRSATNQLCFLLSCGYFRATRQFYPGRIFPCAPPSVPCRGAGLPADTVNLADCDKQTLARHQMVILDFYGFRLFKPHGRTMIW